MNILKRLTISCAVTLGMVLFGGNAFSADITVPYQKIEGNSVVEPGKDVKLNLSPIDTKPANYSSNSVSWKVYTIDSTGNLVEKTFTKNNQDISFTQANPESKYKVFASVSYVYLYKDRLGRINQVIVYNTLMSFDVSVKSAETVPQFITRTVNETVTSNTKVLAASKLADSFGGMAAKIAAGQELDLNSTKQALADSKEANLQALKSINVDPKEWDAFFTKLQDYLYELRVAGKLKTKQDFATTFKNISDGLRGVK